MLAIFISAEYESPTPSHSNSIHYNLIPFKILFYAGEDTLPSYSVAKLIGLFLLQLLYSLPYVVLLYSPVSVNIALNFPAFIQGNNFISLRSQ